MTRNHLLLAFTVGFLFLRSMGAARAEQRFEVPYDSNQRYLAIRAVELQFYPLEKDRKEKAQIRANIVCQSLANDDSYRAAHYTTARNIWYTFTGFKFYNFPKDNRPTEIYDYPRCNTCNEDMTWRFATRLGWSPHYTHYFTSIVCTNSKPLKY